MGAERRPHLGRTRLQLYRYTESLVRECLLNAFCPVALGSESHLESSQGSSKIGA